MVLAVVSPDNPWGSLAFAILYGFVGAAAVLGLYEAKSGDTVGRRLTGLVVVGVDGKRLPAHWRWARASTKLAVLGLLVRASLTLDAHLGGLAGLLPLVGYAVANAMACLMRRDGRGFVDLLVGSQSIAGAPMGRP